MKLFVAGLSGNFDETDLKEMFELYGEVKSAQLIKDRNTGKSKGFGFVDMPNAIEAKETIALLDGVKMYGKLICVKEADDQQQQQRTPGFGGGFNNNRSGGYGNRPGGYGNRPGGGFNNNRSGNFGNRPSGGGGYGNRPDGNRSGGYGNNSGGYGNNSGGYGNRPDGNRYSSGNRFNDDEPRQY
jgi:cold-inducible RNA-binding protein